MVEDFDPSIHGLFPWIKHNRSLFIGSGYCSGFTYFSKFFKCLASSQVADLSVHWVQLPFLDL